MEGDALDLNFVLKRSHSLISTHAKEANEIIAFIGNTGSGKSTLVKFLTKDKTLKIEENAQEECIFVDTGKTISGVGAESFESKTLLPNVTKDEESGCTIVDCAGFNDTRSSEMDFVVAFMNNEYLKMAKRIKIVIVENYSNLRESENRDAFKKSLFQVSELLKLNHANFQTSICLVANKVAFNESTDERHISKVRCFLRELKKFLSEKCSKNADIDNETHQTALKILSYLQEGRVGILHRPSKLADDPWDLDDLKQNYIDLRKLIFEELQFADDACDKFNITVAQETRVWITCTLIDQSYTDFKTSMGPIIRGLENGINEKFKSIGCKTNEKISSVISVGKQIISELSELKSGEDVISFSCNYASPEEINELNFCFKKLKFIYAVVGKNDEKLTDILVGLDGRRSALIEDATNMVEFNEILLDCVKEVRRYEVFLQREAILTRINDFGTETFTTDLSILCSAFGLNEDIAERAISLKKIGTDQVGEFKECLGRSLQNELSNTRHDHVCFIRGKIIILSQQLDSMNIDHQQTRQIVFAATQLLVIDRDLTLENTHLVLVAPLIEIVNEKRLVKLIGENGAVHGEQKAKSSRNNSPGANGLNGNNGFSSGSCKIIALDIRNPQLLEIVSQGGDGSDGQDGGDGHSISCEPPDFYRRKGETTFTSIDFLDDVKNDYHSVKVVRENHPVYELRFENHPGLVIKPSDGGRGGDAGCSAVAGGVEMLVKNASAYLQVALSRKAGAHGVAGKGGSGGEARGMFQMYSLTVVPRKTQSAAANDTVALPMSGGSFGVILASIISAAVAAFAGGSKSNETSWEVVVSHVGESGYCNCAILLSSDGQDGLPATSGPRPQYKFEDGVLGSEAIIEALESFAVEHGLEEEENYQKLIQYCKLKFGDS